MRVHLIVAMAANRVIGAGGTLPWHLSEDLKRFKRLTMGHPVLMGRKTWDSIGRPLPGRANVVITRQRDLRLDGATVVGSLGEALDVARRAGASHAFVIGGGEVFREALPLADVIDLTLIERDYEGDVRFPEFDRGAWREVAREHHEGDPPFAFVTLERRAPSGA